MKEMFKQYLLTGCCPGQMAMALNPSYTGNEIQDMLILSLIFLLLHSLFSVYLLSFTLSLWILYSQSLSGNFTSTQDISMLLKCSLLSLTGMY